MGGVKKKVRSGVELQKLRERRKHVCPQCDTEFQGLSIAVYCSATCRQAAYRARTNLRKKND